MKALQVQLPSEPRQYRGTQLNLKKRVWRGNNCLETGMQLQFASGWYC